MYFFTKGTAKQIISAYQNMVGKPTLPPFWALGWHASSANYTSVDKIKDVVQKYSEHKIPLESIFLDNSYLSSDNFKID